MGKNLVRKEFLSDTTWTCPAGVDKVAVIATNFLFSQISRGCLNALAITSGGALYAWGAGTSGISGTGSVASQSSPILVLGGLSWRQVSGGNATTIGITTNGDAYGWGLNTDGVIGDGTNAAKSSPVLVLGGLKWRQVAVGRSTIGISSDGNAYGWGENPSGELGVGDVTSRSSPVLVLGGLKWRQVAVTINASYGIDSNGDLYAWGNNTHGQLGVGDVIPRSSPVLVLGGLKWKELSTSGANAEFVSAENPFILGITTTGDAYAWGANTNGQLGVGNTTPRSSPVLVLGGLKWKKLSAGCVGATQAPASGGITTSGDAYAWGNNVSGQLGDGTVVAKSSPVLVLGGLKWVDIAVGGGISMTGIATNGSIYAWGSNVHGQLGLGDVVPRSSPVLVLGGFKYPVATEVQANRVILPVTPGTSYPVAVFGVIALFNYTGVYQDPYNSGAIPTKITLEYEA